MQTVRLDSVLFTCTRCGVQVTNSWESVERRMSTEVESCDCCGRTVRVTSDVWCEFCQTFFEVRLL